MAQNILKNPRRALENDANIGSAFASPSLKTASSSVPEIFNLYHTGKGLYLGKLV